MKTYKLLMTAAGAMVFLSGILGGCNSLDKMPLTNISAENVWSDPGFANAFVNARYRRLGFGWAESNQSSVVDETFLIWSRGCEPYTKGTVNPSDLGRMNGAFWGDDLQSWSNVFTNISNCNLFLERAADVPYSSDAERDQKIGEMTFLRALQYHNLVARWGGLPIVTKKFTLDDSDEFSSMKRNTYTECIEFIVSECDKAASMLPAKYTREADIGRATSVAALALKSRVLLYSASPLMNMSGVNPLVGHTSPDPQRWEKAAAAAKACIDAALAAGYAMYNVYPDDVKMNYTRLFWDGANPEILFDKKGTTSAVGAPLHNVSQTNGPNGYGVWGGNVPISEFVDDFEMSDGTRFDWNNPEHRANPYANRDGRLYAYVLCDGDAWRDRTVETYFVKLAGSDENDPNLSGRDTQYGIDNWNTSTSGYNLRKWMDEDYAPNSNQQPNPQFWPYFRLAEMYLNLAEALYHTGDEAGARAAMNVVRTRAKMPDATQSGEELLAKIKHERRIELAFEEHRYYDLRRWLDAEEVLNRDATGVTIILDPATGTKTYTPGRPVEERTFRSPAMYWMPIPLGEIEKNPNLEQNPYYNNETR